MEMTAATLKLHLVPIASIRGPNERVPKPRPMIEMLHEKKRFYNGTDNLNTFPITGSLFF